MFYTLLCLKDECYGMDILDRVAYVNDVFEAANHFKCFDFVLDTVNEPVTEDYIKKLHSMLKNGLMTGNTDDIVIGDYKKYPNEAGMIQTALTEDVPELIRNLLDELNSKESLNLFDIAKFHSAFENIVRLFRHLGHTFPEKSVHSASYDECNKFNKYLGFCSFVT